MGAIIRKHCLLMGHLFVNVLFFLFISNLIVFNIKFVVQILLLVDPFPTKHVASLELYQLSRLFIFDLDEPIYSI